MLPLAAGREAGSGGGAPPYVRHRPERTLLYQLVEKYYPALKAHLVAFSCKRRGFCPSCGTRRMAESAALLADTVFPEPCRASRRQAGLSLGEGAGQCRDCPADANPCLVQRKVNLKEGPDST